ncbi:hypothetical protein ACLOJK_014487 [Asimina triloba]
MTPEAAPDFVHLWSTPFGALSSSPKKNPLDGSAAVDSGRKAAADGQRAADGGYRSNNRQMRLLRMQIAGDGSLRQRGADADLGGTEWADCLLDDADDEAGGQTDAGADSCGRYWMTDDRTYLWRTRIAAGFKFWLAGDSAGAASCGRSGGQAGVDGPTPTMLLQRWGRELMASGTVAIVTAYAAAAAGGPLLQKWDRPAPCADHPRRHQQRLTHDPSVRLRSLPGSSVCEQPSTVNEQRLHRRVQPLSVFSDHSAQRQQTICLRFATLHRRLYQSRFTCLIVRPRSRCVGPTPPAPLLARSSVSSAFVRSPPGSSAAPIIRPASALVVSSAIAPQSVQARSPDLPSTNPPDLPALGPDLKPSSGPCSSSAPSVLQRRIVAPGLSTLCLLSTRRRLASAAASTIDFIRFQI